jgi:Xaa-Pro dipeptidase
MSLTGSCRIEDNIVITKEGSENLTTTIKDPDEMERIIGSS